MYSNTRLSDIMKGLPRSVIAQAVEHTGADKHSKGFKVWDQLLVMVYGQLSGSISLRSLLSRFNHHKAHHYHLGTQEIKRSTLSDANRKRPVEVFETICNHLLQQANRKIRQEGRDLLYLLDSTPIPLKGRGYEWAESSKTHRTTGLKLHTVYSPAQSIPIYGHMTPANINDIEDARTMTLEEGAIYTFDKGYCDYNWWHEIDEKGACFVTRFKTNAALITTQYNRIPPAQQGDILEDSLVRFKNKRPGGNRVNHYKKPLRRVVVHRPDKERPLILATNDLTSPAKVIAERYKARWGIELFFKWIKQNLKIKQFLGRSENAVRIQVLTALIAYLLVAQYRARHGITTSLHLLLSELSVTLFNRPKAETHVANRYRRRRLEFEKIQAALPL